jgi:cellobiose-specific phosphotransferase system component IIC
MLKVIRNVAIIALLALILTVLPGGDNITDGVLLALSLILLGAVALLLVRFWQQSSLTRDTMTDRQRGIVYGALGAIALMIAGTDELFDTGAGTVAWLLIMVVSGWLIFNTWRAANSL